MITHMCQTSFLKQRSNPHVLQSRARAAATFKMPAGDAGKRFMRSYDKFTIALCTTAALAYGAQQYYDWPEAPVDFDLKKWFMGGYDAPQKNTEKERAH